MNTKCQAVGLLFLVGSACGDDPAIVELKWGDTLIRNECIVAPVAMHSKRIALQMTCGPELNEESLRSALGFELEVGDCLILGKEAFCLEEIDGDRATLRAGFDVGPIILRRKRP